MVYITHAFTLVHNSIFPFVSLNDVCLLGKCKYRFRLWNKHIPQKEKSPTHFLKAFLNLDIVLCLKILKMKIMLVSEHIGDYFK